MSAWLELLRFKVPSYPTAPPRRVFRQPNNLNCTLLDNTRLLPVAATATATRSALHPTAWKLEAPLPYQKPFQSSWSHERPLVVQKRPPMQTVAASMVVKSILKLGP